MCYPPHHREYSMELNDLVKILPHNIYNMPSVFARQFARVIEIDPVLSDDTQWVRVQVLGSDPILSGKDIWMTVGEFRAVTDDEKRSVLAWS